MLNLTQTLKIINLYSAKSILLDTLLNISSFYIYVLVL
jgi:hypothetical protein